MWVFFGFITLISFTIYFWYKHINAGWKGRAQSTKEYDYQYKIEWGEEKHVAKLLIGIDAPQGYDYTLKKESGFDRLVKALGIVKEHQTGNIRFDDFVYIVSDNTQFHRQLLRESTEGYVKTGCCRWKTCTLRNSASPVHTVPAARSLPV